MGTVLTRHALGLFAACLLATPALATPSSQSGHAGVIMPVPSITTDTSRPKPIHRDRLDRSTVDRQAKPRKPATPAFPAESAERSGER